MKNMVSGQGVAESTVFKIFKTKTEKWFIPINGDRNAIHVELPGSQGGFGGAKLALQIENDKPYIAKPGTLWNSNAYSLYAATGIMVAITEEEIKETKRLMPVLKVVIR
jgi:hypothetical protein